MQALPGGRDAGRAAAARPSSRPLLRGAASTLAAVNGPALLRRRRPGRGRSRRSKRALEAARRRRAAGCTPRTPSTRAMMDADRSATFAAEVGGVGWRRRGSPIVSNVTGDWITAAEATDPDYWARHLRRAGALRRRRWRRCSRRRAEPVLLEVGPGATLGDAGAAERGPAGGRTVLASLPDVDRRARRPRTPCWRAARPALGRRRRRRLGRRARRRAAPARAAADLPLRAAAALDRRAGARRPSSRLPPCRPPLFQSHQANPIGRHGHAAGSDSEPGTPRRSTLERPAPASPRSSRPCRACRRGGGTGESFLELGFDSLLLTPGRPELQTTVRRADPFPAAARRAADVDDVARHPRGSCPRGGRRPGRTAGGRRWRPPPARGPAHRRRP